MAPPEATDDQQEGMEEMRPAWSLPAEGAESITLPFEWPGELTRDWAWGGSTGKGVRVCILDSGVEAGHPLVGEVQRSVAVSVDADGEATVADDLEGDLCGHGTACAGIVRSLAPDCELCERPRARRRVHRERRRAPGRASLGRGARTSTSST